MMVVMLMMLMMMLMRVMMMEITMTMAMMLMMVIVMLMMMMMMMMMMRAIYWLPPLPPTPKPDFHRFSFAFHRFTVRSMDSSREWREFKKEVGVPYESGACGCRHSHGIAIPGAWGLAAVAVASK